MLRVLTGSAKGRKLSVPPGYEVRPTPEMVRGALFNIIGERVVGCRFLDLFAGTGSVGIEALSRGAAYAAFVESNPKVCNVLQDNLARCKLAASGRVYPLEAVSCLPLLWRDEAPFDLVFLDPPYAGNVFQKFLTQLSRYDIVTAVGLVVVQHFFKSAAEEEVPPYFLQRRKRFGDTVLSFYARS